MIDQEAARRATQEVPSIPRDNNGPVFREPWEAQAFAMTLALHERGLFTWSEWAAALEKLVAEKGVTMNETLHRTRHAWDHACDRTPHGKPIVLTPADFSDEHSH